MGTDSVAIAGPSVFLTQKRRPRGCHEFARGHSEAGRNEEFEPRPQDPHLLSRYAAQRNSLSQKGSG